MSATRARTPVTDRARPHCEHRTSVKPIFREFHLVRWIHRPGLLAMRDKPVATITNRPFLDRQTVLQLQTGNIYLQETKEFNKYNVTVQENQKAARAVERVIEGWPMKR